MIDKCAAQVAVRLNSNPANPPNHHFSLALATSHSRVNQGAIRNLRKHKRRDGLRFGRMTRRLLDVHRNTRLVSANFEIVASGLAAPSFHQRWPNCEQRTDRRTDGRTDGRTASDRLSGMIYECTRSRCTLNICSSFSNRTA